MSTDTLNIIYANEMQNRPYGYALYQPVFDTVIKPGVVGFFDPAGFWSPIADLSDPASLKKAGLKPARHELSAAPPQNQTWGPITSKSVSGHNLDASVGTDPAITGLPISASLQIKYTTSSTFGAVLVTSSPITHSAFYYSSPFSQWVNDNAHVLLSGDYRDDIHRNGLVVVTQTYVTSKCSLTAWTDSKSEVFLGFDAALKSVGDVKPQAGWHEGNSASGWERYEEQEGKKLVVFVGGLWYDVQKEGFGSLLHSDTRSHAVVAPLVVKNSAGDKFQLKWSMKGEKLPKD